jgi:hypothetical protein
MRSSAKFLGLAIAIGLGAPALAQGQGYGSGGGQQGCPMMGPGMGQGMGQGMGHGMGMGMMGPGMMGHMGPGMMGGCMGRGGGNPRIRTMMMIGAADADGDQAVTFDELITVHKRMFDMVDQDRNGKVDREELEAVLSGTDN